MKTLREILDNWHGKGATIVLEDLEPHLLAWAKAYGEQIKGDIMAAAIACSRMTATGKADLVNFAKSVQKTAMREPE